MAEIGSSECTPAKVGRFNLIKDLKFSIDHNQNNIRAESFVAGTSRLSVGCIVLADLTKNMRGEIHLILYWSGD